MTVTERAPCKANLYLDVLGKRADGYHGIESVMTTLPLFDTATVKKADGVRVTMTSDEALSDDLLVLPAEKNLAYRAAKLFFASAKLDGGADIVIEKKIPSRAGLGGGSSDAAAVLRALNKLYGTPFTAEELCKISLPLGADVPFCVAGGCALCRGVGEIIIPIDNKIDFHGLITSERTRKRSTAEAYRLVDEAKCSLCREDGAERMAQALEAGDFDGVCREAYNVFGKACGYPDGARALLSSFGAPFVLMSGAGPAVVALTKSFEDAKDLKNKLEKEGYSSFVF